MEEKSNLTQLLQKPIATMTGEGLCFLITKNAENIETVTPQMASKGSYYGTEGIVRVSDCSISTANRIKKSGIIDEVITRMGRKIIVDVDLTSVSVKGSGGAHIKG